MEKAARCCVQAQESMLEPEAWRLVESYGINLPAWGFAPDVETAQKIAEELGYPVVLKVVSRDIIHKSDVGGVQVSIATSESVAKTVEEITLSVNKSRPGVNIEGWMVTRMIPGGTELIIGGMRDPQFGPTVVCGLGGIFVEVFHDISMRIAPVNLEEAGEMLQELKAYQMLQGVRGQSPVDLKALEQMIVKVSLLMAEHMEVEELDLNPVLATSHGAYAVDARIIINCAGTKIDHSMT